MQIYNFALHATVSAAFFSLCTITNYSKTSGHQKGATFIHPIASQL